jgi:hypothetical protein
MNKFSPILSGIQFKSLYLGAYEISIGMFIKLLRLLPNLDSLEISSLLDIKMSYLFTEDAENIRLLSISNKITKVSQRLIFNQVKFLINLCPRMEHFEGVGIIDKDLEKFVRFILKETITKIPYLHSLRFSVYNLNDKTIQKLQKMLNSEKLLSNYTIRYSDNDISLQWK